MLDLPADRLPFSLPGSLLGISADPRIDPAAYHLRTLHRFSDPRDLHALCPGGEPRSRPAGLTSGRLRIENTLGFVEAVFEQADAVRLRSGGHPLRLQIKGSDHILEPGPEGAFRIDHPGLELAFELVALRGGLRRTGESTVELRPENGAETAEIRIRDSPDSGAPGSDLPFEELVLRHEHDFAAWLDRFRAHLPGADAAALREAAYILWSCQAGPRGTLRRPAVLMSKHWMTAIWSWDNCFNARALARIDPELAWDQFVFFFDHQDPSGRCRTVFARSMGRWRSRRRSG